MRTSTLALLVGLVARAEEDPGRRLSDETHAPTVTFAPTSVEFKNRWWNVSNFDCLASPNPVQVLSENGRQSYHVAQLNLGTFEYDEISNMQDIVPNIPEDTPINAAALWIDEATEKNYAFASIGKKLCAVDKTSRSCLAPDLKNFGTGIGASAGAIWGNNYYYFHGDFGRYNSAKEAPTSADPTEDNTVYAVKDFTTTPVFTNYGDAAVNIKPPQTAGSAMGSNIDDVLSGPVHDITLLMEDGDPDGELIKDGDPNGIYLIGVAKRKVLVGTKSFLILKINPTTAMVDKYYVVDTVINWDACPVPQEKYTKIGKSEADSASNFGATYTYLNTSTGYKGARAFASANDGWGLRGPEEVNSDTTVNNGWGLFEITLPIDIQGCAPNTGTVTSSHAPCTTAPAVELTCRMPSERTANNDGLNCLYADPDIPATPTPSSQPSALPLPVPTLAPIGTPVSAPTPLNPYEPMNCTNETVHRYDDRAACCEDLAPDAVDDFLDDLSPAQIQEGCAHHGFT
jgi:hypothetical protein